jgi:hypothetical protein
VCDGVKEGALNHLVAKCRMTKMFCLTISHVVESGLPDFSWYKIPKLEKYTKLPQTIPNVHKIYLTKDRKMDQVSIKYTNIFH